MQTESDTQQQQTPPNAPLYKDAKLRCLNATDGSELWTIMDYGNQMYGGQSPIADGYLTTLNSYDARIYCFGKGPSALTVSAPDIAVESGTPVVIRGTIIDIAAGTKQDEQAARFPSGVPAVSDESMAAWMEYVYMQKPKPTNVVGVTIAINVIDSKATLNSRYSYSDAQALLHLHVDTRHPRRLQGHRELCRHRIILSVIS